MTIRTNERGIALAAAIFALVVIGALVAAAFFVGTQEQRVGRNGLKVQQAFSAAEGGAQAELNGWNSGVLNTMALGGSAAFGGWLADSSGWFRGTVRRLDSLIYLVESEGFSRDSTTRQHVGQIVRLRPVEVNISSALKTQGALNIGGSTYIDGDDHSPTGWTGCGALQPSLPGIEIKDSSQITTSGCGGFSCINGSPKIQEDTTITTDSLTTFGDANFEDLKALATKIITGGNRKIAPSLSGTACKTSDENNWGDPLNPTAACGTYFPVTYVTGTISINGDQGQGVLIVDGDLSVQGGFEFFGPVIVRGTLKTTGTGGHFNGGVIAANIDLDLNTVLGNAVVQYNSCALVKALINSAPPSLLQSRAWANLY